MAYLEAEVAGLLNGESKVDPVPGIVDDEHQGSRWKRPTVKQPFKVSPRGVFMGGGVKLIAIRFGSARAIRQRT